jgi:hypothetical protein
MCNTRTTSITKFEPEPFYLANDIKVQRFHAIQESTLRYQRE